MAHIYTCTTATGDITDLSTETSGNIKINYTLSSTTAGSAGTNTADGTYEDVVAFDGAIALVGYTGVVTVNSVNGLDTKTQRTEQRLLTTDSTYYINGLIQDVTPPVPDADTIINTGNTSIIGYADTIDRREADFKVWTTVRTDAQALADYNTWVLTYKDVLTDGNGDYLTDGDGRYLYT